MATEATPVEAATTATKAPGETAKKAHYRPVMEAAHTAWLAAIGAGALTYEEFNKVVKRLVERGAIAEADGRKMLRESTEHRKKQAKKAESEMDKRIEEILNRMNIPTKSEIDALGAKITALTKKIEELKKSQPQ